VKNFTLGPLLGPATIAYRQDGSFRGVTEMLAQVDSKRRGFAKPIAEKTVRLVLQQRTKPQAAVLSAFFEINKALDDWPVDYEIMVTEYELARRYEELFDGLREGTKPLVEGFLAVGEEILARPAGTFSRRWLQAKVRFFLPDIEFEAFAAGVPAFGREPEDILARVCEGYLQSHREFKALQECVSNGDIECSARTRDVLEAVIALMCAVTAEQVLSLVMLCADDEWLAKKASKFQGRLPVTLTEAESLLPTITEFRKTAKLLRRMLPGDWHRRINWNEAAIILACGCVGSKHADDRYLVDLRAALAAVATDIENTKLRKKRGRSAGAHSEVEAVLALKLAKVEELETLPATKSLTLRGAIRLGWIRSVILGNDKPANENEAGAIRRRAGKAVLGVILLAGLSLGLAPQAFPESSPSVMPFAGYTDVGAIAVLSGWKPVKIGLAIGPGGTRPG
jgi:hypothetical protein